MENNSGLCGTEDREIQEPCDGCGQLASKLVPIGDGSIKVCGACYAEATVMVFTQTGHPLLKAEMVVCCPTWYGDSSKPRKGSVTRVGFPSLRRRRTSLQSWPLREFQQSGRWSARIASQAAPPQRCALIVWRNEIVSEEVKRSSRSGASTKSGRTRHVSPDGDRVMRYRSRTGTPL